MKKRLWVILSLVLLLCFSACRVRLTDVEPAEQGSFPAPEVSSAEGIGVDGDKNFGDDENHSSNLKEIIADNSQTIENPDSLRKEFDENAAVEIIGGTDRLLHAEGEGEGAFADSSESAFEFVKVSESADETALLTVSADNAEEKGVSEEGETAESLLQYYTVLLEDRGKSLYECKRLYVYWETADHVTIYKTSPEHQLILNAGAYDVSSRLLEENLEIDDGWVVRKNPDVIVKVVDSNVLGSAVSSMDQAEIEYQELFGREGWSGIEAVRQNRVLLLSEELLSEPWLQIGAMLALAKTANPDLYEDVNVPEALTALITEATGTVPTGVFFYPIP